MCYLFITLGGGGHGDGVICVHYSEYELTRPMYAVHSSDCDVRTLSARQCNTVEPITFMHVCVETLFCVLSSSSSSSSSFFFFFFSYLTCLCYRNRSQFTTNRTETFSLVERGGLIAGVGSRVVADIHIAIRL